MGVDRPKQCPDSCDEDVEETFVVDVGGAQRVRGDPADGSGAHRYRDDFGIGAPGFSGFGEPSQFGDSQ